MLHSCPALVIKLDFQVTKGRIASALSLDRFRGVAQLAEHWFPKPAVASSIPAAPAFYFSSFSQETGSLSREVATSQTDSPLLSELLSAGVYKRTQGLLVRRITCAVVWAVVAVGCWRLYETLKGSEDGVLETAVPGGLFIAGLWFGFRLVNWPRFADFLIAVEAEMNKVTWPSATEIKRSSVVVIFTIFFLAIVLFLFDIVWQQLFVWLNVTS